LESLYLSQCSLSDQLSASLNRESELNSQLSWEKLQFKNQVESYNHQLLARDEKIERLQKEVEVKVSKRYLSYLISNIADHKRETIIGRKGGNSHNQ